LISAYLVGRERLWGITAVTELRVQVKPTRFRVPDIVVIANPFARTRILREPPLLCIEILSPEDRMVKVQEVVDDYLDFGVPCVWIVNPGTRRGFVCTPEGMVEAKDGVLRVAGSRIEVPLADLG
jgi:Uma2 family endonuclease